MKNIKESDLYEPVKDYLTKLGYDIKAEVNHCDITALKGEELIVIELKKGFTLGLIYQALRRKQIADSVYVAVPLPKKGYSAPHYKDMIILCNQLEIGLIFIGFTTKGAPQVDVVLDPKEAKPVRKNNKKRVAVLNEHNGRTGSQNVGGVARRKIMTVYKEKALFIAKLLNTHGELKAQEIRAFGACEKTSSILGKNYYKWYDKKQDLGNRNTTYQITKKGIEALQQYKHVIQ